MTRLIVNADDFGYCEGVNNGIIAAHKNGIVTSCTMMANMPGFEHGIKLLKENQSLGCGVHMTLSCNRPLLDTHKTIVDENGNFYRRVTDEIIKNIDVEEVYNEFKAQIEKVKAAGIEITHLDSHHHVHLSEGLSTVVARLTKEYNLPMRGLLNKNVSYKNSVPCLGTFYKDNVREEYFENNLEEIKRYEWLDLMSHPAFTDEYLMKSTSYSYERSKEYAILTSKKVKNLLKENNIELVNYRNFK